MEVKLYLEYEINHALLLVTAPLPLKSKFKAEISSETKIKKIV